MKTVITDRRQIIGALAVFLVIATVAVSVLADSKSHARDPYALLFGTVYGLDNRPEYGVHIKIRRADQKRPKWELMSDHQGEFAQRVPAGKADYVITADVKTAKGQPKPELTVHVDNDERKDFVLHLK
jgi:hypothetical protein